MKLRMYKVNGHYIPHQCNGSSLGSGITDTTGLLSYYIIENTTILELKSKKFEVLNVELPDSRNDIKDIIDVYKRYGKYVAVILVDIMKHEKERRLYFKKVMWISEKVKDINKYPDNLLNLIAVDNDLAAFGDFVLDVVTLDRNIRELFPNIIFGTSMKEMVRMMFGKDGVELIEKLLETNK